jgi:hypothetical protein
VTPLLVARQQELAFRTAYVICGDAAEAQDATGPLVRSGPALIWERAGRVFRLEGEPSPTWARAIAASVR